MSGESSTRSVRLPVKDHQTVNSHSFFFFFSEASTYKEIMLASWEKKIKEGHYVAINHEFNSMIDCVHIMHWPVKEKACGTLILWSVRGFSSSPMASTHTNEWWALAIGWRSSKFLFPLFLCMRLSANIRYAHFTHCVWHTVAVER